MKITAKQEKFAQCVADGKTQADAYRAAFACSKSKPETIQNNASILMKNSEVAARVKELRDKLASKALWTREDSVNTLKDVLSDPDAKASDKTGAVKVLNEMHGFNAPTEAKVETTIRIVE